jgi:hypothetical protein
VIGGVERAADNQQDEGQKDDAGEKLHGLQFTYLINAVLDVPVDEMNATPSTMAPNAAINRT